LKILMFLTIALSSYSAFAGKTYQNYPELTKLIEEMRESASGGASLSYFGYTDGMPEDSSLSLICADQSLSAEDVINEFSELAESMYSGRAPTMDETQFKKLKESGLSDFTLLIGQGPFKECSVSTHGTMTAGKIKVRIGMEYTFTTEVGWED
jgi:hypothetical protein